MNKPGLADIHVAAQYLAAAGISFLEKQDDDSHTNLGYSASSKQFFTRPLNISGDYLALDLLNFSLRWIALSGSQEFPLDGKSHAEVLDWLKSTTENQGLSKQYRYHFHYSLPYDVSDAHVFRIIEEALQQERELRELANAVLSHILSKYSIKSEIRIWPHHFDTGAISTPPGSDSLSIGMGLAIPDSLVDQYYFYISGTDYHQSLNTSSFTALSDGKWINDGFKGAVLSAGNTDKDAAVRFFSEAIEAYIH